MATTQPTSFPTPRPHAQAYVTPPNSQGYPPHIFPQFPQQHPPFPPMDPSQSPANLSPTSPSHVFQLPLANRQMRPPKSPMYVPAALRPTERLRPSPLTPPRSVHGSTDSLDNADPNRPISRRSTTADSKRKGALGKVSEDEPSAPPIPTDDLPAVTGLPDRSHWKLDSIAPICDAPVCQKRFGLWERRHHCRHCGNVYCGEHSGWQVPLDQDANYHPSGAQSRVCGHCWGQYDQWLEERRQKAESGELTMASTPVKAVAGRGKGVEGSDKRGSIAQSLTRDWNWSTF